MKDRKTLKMKEKNIIRYTLQPSTFEIHAETGNSIQLDLPFAVCLRLPDERGILTQDKTNEISFHVQEYDKQRYQVIFNSCQILIKTEKSNDWHRFVKSNLLQLVGLLAAVWVCKGQEDFIWVEPSQDNNIWILGILWNVDREVGEAFLVERPKPTQSDWDIEFWLLETIAGPIRQKQAADKLFNLLKTKDGLNLPADIPFFQSESSLSDSIGNRQLSIKLHSSQMWFLLLPFDYFKLVHGYGSFNLYNEVEWVISDEKSVLQNYCERLTIQMELQRVRNFFKCSVIILNIYKHFKEKKPVSKKVKNGARLVCKTLNILQDIKFGGELLSIRWHVNPKLGVIGSELLNHETKYFFANFHTEKGDWQSSTGEIVSQSLQLKKGALAHIRLMRVFHCDSVLRVDATRVYPSIVSSLLAAGALRVEGGIGKEDCLDFICSLLYLFWDLPGLRMMLEGRCFEKGIDVEHLKSKIDEFLISCHWPLPGGIK
jgi:hypothetical protein